MRDIMAGLDEKDSQAVHPCRGAEADSPVAVHVVVDVPVQCCRALTVEIPQFLVLLMTCLSLCNDRCVVRQCRKPCWCRSCVPRGR